MKKCSSCGALQFEWESAWTGESTCGSCGVSLNPVAPTSDANRKLRVAPRTELVANASAAVLTSASEPLLSSVLNKTGDRAMPYSARLTWTPRLYRWLLVAAVALPLAGLRYGGFLPAPVIATVKQYGLSYGVWALLAIHVMIVVKAAQEDMTAGLMCLLIPLYSFYYLLAQPENHLLRMALCALLVTIGPETYAGLTDQLTVAGAHVHAWIGGHGYEAGFE